MTSTALINSQIRICFVSPKVYPLFDFSCQEVFGGAEVDLYNLGTEIAKEPGFAVSFVTADYGQEPEVQIDEIRLIRSLDFKESRISGAVALWRAMAKANADVYMIKTVSIGVPLVAWFCRRHHRRFLYRTASELECDGRYVQQHPLMGRLFLWSLRQADRILTQNEIDRRNLESTLGLKSAMIHNGHRLGEVPAGPRQSVLWVGRSDSIKGPYRFVELARRSPSEHFVMICQQATGDAHYEQLVGAAKAVPNVTFIERVPFHETDSYFGTARVLVNTSDSEGFSNTFIQACKWSVPILSLNVNPDDFLTRYSCGLCCGGDEGRLAEGLRFLLADDRYVELGRNARKYVEANHDITKIVDMYKDLFRKLAQ